jgi:drug/metabolite transporter (DMT)-like permease
MYVAWGTTYIGIALTIASMPDLLAMGMRFTTAAFLQTVVVGLSSGFGQFRIPKRQVRNALFLGTIMTAVGIGTVSTSEHVVPVGVAALMIASMPLWTVVLRLFDKDRPHTRTLVGVAVGFIGLLIIMQPGKTVPRAGGEHLNLFLWMCVLLIGNLLWSFGSFITPRLELPSRPLVLTSYEMFAAGIVLMGIGLVGGQRFSDVFDATLKSWLGWSYLVLVGSVVGYTTYNWLLTHAPISLVSTYTYVNPVVATALGWLIFHEPVTSNIWIGGSLVLFSVALIALSERVRSSLTQEITKAESL